MNFGEDFGQKVDLTASIRNILRNYPEGTAILKELIQNADDAGARNISFCLDLRHHNAKLIASTSLVQFQGPSLLVYNDAVFTKEDFKSIQRIGDSLKKTSDTKTKIGRFGIGFNAIYHLTDLPSFVSSTSLVMFDPQAKFLPNVNPSNPGKIIDYLADPELLITLADQFKPYEAYGLDWRKPFDGTIFRLPLRTEAQARESLLSNRASDKNIHHLLQALQEEAASMLLFLKNIESIEIKTWPANDSLPVSAFHCNISNVNEDLRNLRSCTKFVSNHDANIPLYTRIFSMDYSLVITINNFHDSVNEELWEVCNQLGGTEANEIANDSANSALRLVPWGGVAACITPVREGGGGGAQKNYDISSGSKGLAYCFLPLPVRTGLPVMLNGFFELSSNRRDIWQASTDMTGDGETRAVWNIALLRSVVAPSYSRLLSRLKEKLGFTELYQRHWPSTKSAVTSPWKELAQVVLDNSRNDALLLKAFTEETLSNQTALIETGISKSAHWLTPSDSVVLPASGLWYQSDDEENWLVDILRSLKVPLVRCSSHLRDTLEEASVCSNIAAPSFIRRALREYTKKLYPNSCYGPAFLSGTACCRFLLHYCMLDLREDAVNAELDNLLVLPLLSGDAGIMRVFTAEQSDLLATLVAMEFSPSLALQALLRSNFQSELALEYLTNPNANSAQPSLASTSMFVLCGHEEMQVFAGGASQMILSRDVIGVQEIELLSQEVVQRCSNIRLFSANLVSDLLRKILPNYFLNGAAVSYESLVAAEDWDRIVNFLNVFWIYASAHPEVVSAVAEGFALLPTTKKKVVMPLSRVSNLIMIRQSTNPTATATAATTADNSEDNTRLSMSVDVAAVLCDLGATLIDLALLPSLAAKSSELPPAFWSYVYDTSRSRVLSLLDSLVRAAGKAGSDCFLNVTPVQRDLLLHFIATSEPLNFLTIEEKLVIRQKLPLFASFSGSNYFILDSLSKGTNNGTGKKLLLQNSKKIASTLSDTRFLHASLFPDYFVRHNADVPQQLQLLGSLQVTVLSRSSYFKEAFLPNIQSLYDSFPEDTEKDVFQMLSELSNLSVEDPLFVNDIRKFAFVPCGRNGSSSISKVIGKRLFLPSELFDPSIDELSSLLDPSFFPCELLRRGDILVYLRAAGLRTELDWQSIIECARVISSSRSRVNYSENSDGEGSQQQQQQEQDRSCQQGASLLHYLDTHTERLFSSKASQSEGKSKADKNTRGNPTGSTSTSAVGLSLFGFSSFFNQNITNANPGTSSSQSEEISISSYLEELQLLEWMPTLTTPLHPLMPWPNTTSTTTTKPLTCPSMCRTSSDAWYCSASLCVAAVTISSEPLRSALGWNQPIPFYIIAIQLRELGKKFMDAQTGSQEQQRQPQQLQHLQLNEIESSSSTSSEVLSTVLPQLYQRLHAVVSNADELEVVSNILAGYPCVWVGDRFVRPDQAAFVCAINISPYLYQVPVDSMTHRSLFSALGVKDSFGIYDYLQVLRQLASETGAMREDAKSATTTESCSALSQSQLSLVLSLVSLLDSDNYGGGGGGGILSLKDREVYLPDNSCRLGLSTSLVLDDVPWMAGPVCAAVRSTERMLHASVAAKIAHKVGVRSLRNVLISRSADSSSIFDEGGVSTRSTSAAKSGGGVSAEAFGQAESLTNRLKTILDMYPDGSPIFSELIQNADDAGASVVRILLDENSYGTESLLAPTMTPLQGPALLIYNDALFSESDFRSLARIGQGSKMEKLATTGRFGLGFNSVYHLTDVPSFVSGDSLVYFDPHTAFVPGATASQPGLRIRLSQSHGTLGMEFPNQCQPFNFFGCDFAGIFPGTLFRFPLRSEALARKSEVSRTAYQVADIASLIDQLRTLLPVLPLFLRSVTTIEVYRCSQGKSAPLLLYSVSKSTRRIQDVGVGSPASSLLSFFDKTLDHESTRTTTPPPPPPAQVVGKGGGGGGGITVLSSRDDFYALLSRTPDSELPYHIDDLTIALKEGSAGGDIARTERWVYLVVSGICGGRAKKMACHINTRHLKLVPMGAVAACVEHWESDPCPPLPLPTLGSISNHGKTDDDASNASEVSSTYSLPPPPPPPGTGHCLSTDVIGRAFCFLPLPVLTQLPVHVNAYFELNSSRRDIWRGQDTTGEARAKSEWNELLMREVLSSLYAKLLVSRTDQLKHCAINKEGKEGKLTAILRLLPCPPPPSPWDQVSLALFTLLKELEVIWTESNGGGFFAAGKTYFLNEEEVLSVDSISRKLAADETADSNVGDPNRYLHSLLLSEGIPVVRTSSIICSTLMAAGCAGGLVSPSFVRSHFRTADLSVSLLTSRVHPSLLTSTAAGTESGVSGYNLDAAVFLLRYCLRDIPPVSVTALMGLPLLPLEDGSLGRIGDNTDPPLFLVSEAERKLLLGRAGGSIVASETYLGHSFASMLQNSTFLECSNVHQLVPLDMLKMLSRIVPSEWLAASVLVVTRHEKSVRELGLDDLWLRNLWSYLSELEVVSLFGSVLPVIPVGGIGPVPSGLAKVSPSIPILHVTTASRDLSGLATEALSLLGIHIFNPAVLGGQSYSASVTALLSDTSPYGHLRSILSSPNITAAATSSIRHGDGDGDGSSTGTPYGVSTGSVWTTMSTGHRDALRGFILDDLLSKLGAIELNQEQARLLRSLPVWQCCSNCEIQVDGADRERDTDTGKSTTATSTTSAIRSSLGDVSIDEAGGTDGSSGLILIPPKGLAERWLCPDFVKLRDDHDRSLYRMLGLEELSHGHFIMRFLIPRILRGELADLVDDIALFILKNLSAYELDCPGLTEFLSSKPFIRNTEGVCCPPDTLFDPAAAHLSALLPPESFPASPLCVSSDPSLLHSLRLLGLGNTLTCRGVVRVATSLHKHAKSDTTVDESLRVALVNRGAGLLKHLDLHIEQLLEEAGQGSAAESQSLRTILQEGNTEFDLNDFDDAGSLVVTELEQRGGDLTMLRLFCGAIRLLAWLPVLTGPPPSSSLVQLLPWPTALHTSSYLAAPRDCRSIAEAWCCSSTMRIACTDPISTTCKLCFGWQTPLSGHSVSQQLLALSQSYITASSGSSSSSNSTSNSILSALSLQLHKSFPVIMQLLSEAYQKDPMQAEQWLAALTDKPVLWIGGRFIEPSRVAFQSLNGVDAEPYLFVARSDWMEFRPLLLSLGARECFGPADLVSMLAELAKTHPNTPLAEPLLDVALGILKILCRLYEKDPQLEGAKEGGGVGGETPGSDDDEASQDGLEVTSSGSSDSCDSSSLPERQKQVRQTPPLVDLKTLWPVFVPDANRILMPSTSLTINDAPWFTPTFNALQKRNRENELGIRLTHSRVDPSVGRLVGVRSLREQLFAGDDIMCPHPRNLQSLVGGDSLSECLGSLVGLADDLGARSVQTIYDQRQHSCESLMHPGLSAAQGPSISLYLEGVRLGTEGIIQALASPTILRSPSSTSPLPAYDNYMSSPKKIKDVMLDGISSAMHSSSSGGSGDGSSSYASASKRLSSCFTVTDCLQIISGSSFYIFDPCGSHLLGIEGMNRGLDDGGNATATSSITAGSAADASSSSTPRGQRCVIIGDNSKEVLSRFPDQFEPLLSLPFSGGIGKMLLSKGELPGLLLRLPLRSQPSAVSRLTLREEDIGRAFRSLKSQLEGALLFGHKALRSGTILHWPAPPAREPVLELDIELLDPPAARGHRKQSLFTDQSWKKSGGLSALFKSFVPTESSTTSTLQVTLGMVDDSSGAGSSNPECNWLAWSPVDRPSVPATPDSARRDIDADQSANRKLVTGKDHWKVLSVLGPPTTRSLALQDPYLSLRMTPVVSLAARALRRREEAGTLNHSHPLRPQAGFVFCGAGALSDEGLPFHIEGPFLQDFSVQGLSMPPPPAERRIAVTMPSPKTSSSSSSSPSLPRNSILMWNSALVTDIMEILVPKLLQEVRSDLSKTTLDRSVLYVLWPYLPRMAPRLAHVARTSKMLLTLSSLPIYLRGGELGLVKDCLLTTSPVPAEVRKYLQSGGIPISAVPCQITNDLLAYSSSSHFGLRVLTPSALRDILKRDAELHCRRLRGSLDQLVIPLLRFCLSDIPNANESRETKRKYFRSLAGCPLLPSSDGNIRCLPGQARDRAVFASAALQAMLPPTLSRQLVHPLGLQFLFDLSMNHPDAKDTLFVGGIDSAFLEDHSTTIFPVYWRGIRRGIYWNGFVTDPGLESYERKEEADTSLSSSFQLSSHANPSQSFPSPLFIFTLWKDMFSVPAVPLSPVPEDLSVELDERQRRDLKRLEEWPLLPVLSAGRKVLLDPTLLSYCIWEEKRESTSSQSQGTLRGSESHSQTLNNLSETIASDWLNSLRSRDIGVSASVSASDSGGTSSPSSESILWGWTSEPRVEKIASNQGSISTSSSTATTTAVHQTEGIAQSPVSTTAGTPVPSSTSTATVPTTRRSHEELILQEILRTLGFPVIDKDFFLRSPLIAAKTAPVFRGLKLLRALLELCNDQGDVGEVSGGIPIFDYSTTAADASVAATASRSYLLDFNALTTEDRTTLLLEIFRGTTESDRQTLLSVKHLPLFTARDGRAVTVDSNRGAVWCASEHVAEEVDLCRRFSKSEVLFPVILMHNAILVERVYSVIDISELNSIGTVVQRFLLPALMHGHMSAENTLLVMSRLKEKWTNYREVPELLNTLRKVAFIPIEKGGEWGTGRVGVQQNGAVAESLGHHHHHHLEESVGYYRPEEMISWKNEELFGILRSRPYFPPNSFRDESWHEMLIDLGMTLTLTKEKLITIAGDMEAAFQTQIESAEGGATGVAVAGGQFSVLRQEATSLLTYFCGQNGVFAELLDFSLAKRLSTVRFIPVEAPVAVEPGGALLTRWEVVRFCDVLARSSAALAYSVLPVLPVELEPSQIYFSSLGITANPPLELILRHLRHLIDAAPLDRWSTPSHLGLSREPQLIFSVVFQQLQDHWNDISPTVRNTFSEIDLIPVGHHLVKASRLFFRLTEDLSPFMYELPRCFGPQEILLKKIGVSECPSVTDYLQFLQELACETDDSPLNPNELNAVLSIVQLIVSELIESNVLQGNAYGDAVGSFFVPDEDAVLRNVRCCVANDDDWLHDRSTSTLKHLGYYFLHPKLLSSSSSSSSIYKQGGGVSTNDTATTLVSLLNVPLLSSIVCEVLSSRKLKTLDTCKNQIDSIKKALCTSSSFALSVFGLFKKMKLPLSVSTTAQSSLSVDAETSVVRHLLEMLGNIDIQLVEDLQTQLVILDDRMDRRDVSGTHINGPGMSYPSLSYLKRIDATSSTASPDVIQPPQVPGSQETESGSGRDKLIVFVNEGLLAPPVTLSLAVSRGICQSLSLPLYVAPTVSLLLDSVLIDPDQYQYRTGSTSMSTSLGFHTAAATATTIYNCLNIGSNSMTTEAERDVDGRATHNSSESSQKIRRGWPGQPVTETDQALLELKPFRVFKRGEVVAVSVNHNDANYNSMGSSASSTSSTSNNGSLKYGIVVSSGGYDGNIDKNMREISVTSVLPKLTINIGESSLMNVVSTEVYSFRSTRKAVKPSSKPSSDNTNPALVKKEGAITSLTSRRNQSSTPDNIIQKSYNSGIISSTATTTRGLSDTSSTSSPIINSSTATTTAAAAVASSLQSDVVEALHSLLLRCQIPQNLDTESMCSRILELSDKLAVTDHQLQLERTKLTEVTGILNQTLTSWRCEICVTNDRSYVMAPCGHTLCHTCQEKLQQNRCPFCRANIHQKIRFFIPEGTNNIR